MPGRDQAHTQVQLTIVVGIQEEEKVQWCGGGGSGGRMMNPERAMPDRGGLVDWLVGWSVGPTRSQQQQPGRKSQKDSQW
jgi:hypothetical protein